MRRTRREGLSKWGNWIDVCQFEVIPFFSDQKTYPEDDELEVPAPLEPFFALPFFCKQLNISALFGYNGPSRMVRPEKITNLSLELSQIHLLQHIPRLIRVSDILKGLCCVPS